MNSRFARLAPHTASWVTTSFQHLGTLLPRHQRPLVVEAAKRRRSSIYEV